MTSGAAACPAGTAKGPTQVLAQTRLQLTQARDQEHPEECIRILECRVLEEETEMRQAQPMPEDGSGASQISSSCRGVDWGNQVVRVCESSLTPRQNGCMCTKCQTWTCSAECERAVVSMHCCRLTGVVLLGSTQSFYSEGPGGSAAPGTRRESQNDGQAIDVQVVEAQDDSGCGTNAWPTRLRCGWRPPRQVSKCRLT